jgi:hypothetical protein
MRLMGDFSIPFIILNKVHVWPLETHVADFVMNIGTTQEHARKVSLTAFLLATALSPHESRI